VSETEEPTTESVDALLRFLPDFEREGFEFGTWDDAGSELIFDLSSLAGQFVAALYDHGWVVPFDWVAWQDEAVQLYESPEALGKADIQTLRKLLTLHVRKDRFCEGHLAAVFESGHVTAILQRLRKLRETMGGE